MREPWSRQIEAGEGEAAYQAFVCYRELPPGRRSVVEVARECGKNRSLITRWSARWSWVERVAAFDQFTDDARVSAQLEALTEMWKRHTSMALVGQQQALAWLQQVDPARLRDEVGLRLLVETTRLEQMARGAVAYEDGGLVMPAGPARTLAEMFAPAGPGETKVTELELARFVVERSHMPEPGDDWDLELAELVEGGDPTGAPAPVGDDGGDEDDPAEVPLPEAEVDPEPEEPPALRETLRYVDEGGQRVRRLVPPPAPPAPPPPPRRHRGNGRR
jgi:hypothetical protein